MATLAAGLGKASGIEPKNILTSLQGEPIFHPVLFCFVIDRLGQVFICSAFRFSHCLTISVGPRRAGVWLHFIATIVESAAVLKTDY